MTSNDKEQFYVGKNDSPVSSAIEPVEYGKVSKMKRHFHFKLEVRQEESSFAVTKNASNADFDPIPPSKRTWNWGAYVAYWMADAWAVSNWEVGESPPIRPRETTLRDCPGSFFHYRRRPELEIGNRCLRSRKRHHGSRHHRQRQDGCQSAWCPCTPVEAELT